MEDEEYAVEKILDRRIQDGRIEYYLKWKGYGDDGNTWEPEVNLQSCPELIAEFEHKRNMRKYKKNEKKVKERKSSAKADSSNEKERSISVGDDRLPRGFEQGLEMERIVGVTASRGDLMFLIKWRGRKINQEDLVPAQVANIRWPQHVIQFYQERLVFIE